MINLMLATRIKKDLVDPNLYDDVKYNIRSKSRWKLIADISETFAQVLLCASVVLSFASGSFDQRVLSFIAGAFGAASMSLLLFSSYSMRESKERTAQVNIILRSLGINQIPDITIDSASDPMLNSPTSPPLPPHITV